METEDSGMQHLKDESMQNVNENTLNESVQNKEEEISNEEKKPLRKIHPKLHSFGRYKMFSNHSSANDMPHTSTGA